MIGLVFTLLVSQISLAYSNIFFKKKEKEEHSVKKELADLKELIQKNGTNPNPTAV